MFTCLECMYIHVDTSAVLSTTTVRVVYVVAFCCPLSGILWNLDLVRIPLESFLKLIILVIFTSSVSFGYM